MNESLYREKLLTMSSLAVTERICNVQSLSTAQCEDGFTKERSNGGMKESFRFKDEVNVLT